MKLGHSTDWEQIIHESDSLVLNVDKKIKQFSQTWALSLKCLLLEQKAVYLKPGIGQLFGHIRASHHTTSTRLKNFRLTAALGCEVYLGTI
ncbi:hypothetical protein BpHYR1_013346 [Brachionus plicatilis]|uniref:Uncharacterized protein n=1 Tax=Brachionus plicatilis TaxID=10195 RepID=A0A3M7Q9Q8_BRAPC|nr:hypothetical protein BpHYR1_013346 [Brachionus plicatilis]